MNALAIWLREFADICSGMKPVGQWPGVGAATKLREAATVLDTLTQQQGGEQEAGDGERIYCEARECESCGHAGINDSHTVNAACLECDWSGPSPQEDKCPACQQTGVMTAACSRCDGRYRLVAEAEIPALRTKQPAASEGDGIRVERAEYFSPTEGGHFLRVVYRWPHNGKLLLHTQFVELHSKDQVEHLIALLNTSKQAAGEAVPIGWFTDDHLTDRSATTYDKTVADRWVAKGWPITPIYTTPPRHPADEKVQIKSSTIELALFEEENETAYPGYARLHIPYDTWNWDMDVENLLVNRKNIDFAESTKDYYGKVPITHIRATIDGKTQVTKLSKFLCLGPERITPIFAAGQLRIAAL